MDNKYTYTITITQSNWEVGEIICFKNVDITSELGDYIWDKILDDKEVEYRNQMEEKKYEERKFTCN